MIKINKFYLIGLLVLLPVMSKGQNEVDSFITQLKSGNALAVQEAKDSIIRRWFYIYADEPNNSETKRFKKDLIQIIDEDTTIPDTVADHQRSAQIAIQKGQQAHQVALSDVKTAAIFLIEALNIKEAIPSLVKHINYVTPGRYGWESSGPLIPSLEYYPSALALTMMNDTTAIPLLVDVVKKHKDSGTRLLAGEVIFRLESDKNRNSLDQAYSLSTDSTEQKNLEETLWRIRLIKPIK